MKMSNTIEVDAGFSSLPTEKYTMCFWAKFLCEIFQLAHQSTQVKKAWLGSKTRCNSTQPYIDNVFDFTE